WGVVPPASTVDAVEQAHHAFDDGDLSAGGAVPEQRRDQVVAAQERVQVPRRPARGQRVVAGVDVVGADLVPGDRQPPRAQRRHQPAGHGGLAAAGRRGGDDQARDGYHSMPFCPFWPASMGCLTFVISVTRSAASISLGSASRPVITTCCWPGRAASTLTTSSTSTQPHFSGEVNSSDTSRPY